MSLYNYQGNVIEMEPYLYTTPSLFHRFGVCGASWDNGYYYKSANTHVTREDLSWGANLARRNGNVFRNYAVTGATTRSWLTSSGGLSKMLNDEACDLYITTLGGNDSMNIGIDYLGSITDITSHESYADYPDTYYGNYGKIIEQVMGKNNKAKIIVMMGCSQTASQTRKAFAAAAQEIAEHYNVPFINWYDDPYYASEWFKNAEVHDHPTPITLAGLACIFERLFSECVKNNYEYFRYYDGSTF